VRGGTPIWPLLTTIAIATEKAGNKGMTSKERVLAALNHEATDVLSMYDEAQRHHDAHCNRVAF
jgi:hypothetical protein